MPLGCYKALIPPLPPMDTLCWASFGKIAYLLGRLYQEPLDLVAFGRTYTEQQLNHLEAWVCSVILFTPEL